MEYKLFGQKIRLELIILILIIGVFIVVNMFCSCHGGVREAFQVSKDLTGSALDYVMGQDIKSSWNYKHGGDSKKTYNDWTKHLESNVGGQVPLPEGELFMFAQNRNSPDCCPSHYGSSTGCVCISPEQYSYLNKRGGNRTLTTEY